MLNGRADGTGYDVDYNQDGTIVQQNYGHDNAGGFILLCTDNEPRAALVRFNLSLDEVVFDQTPCGIPNGHSGTLSGVRVYNNTLLTPTALVRRNSTSTTAVLPQAGDFQFFNNIVVATKRQALPFPCGHECCFNLFWGLPPSGRHAVVANPRFASGHPLGSGRLQAGAGFKLRPDSPAIGPGSRSEAMTCATTSATRWSGLRPSASSPQGNDARL